MVNLGWADTAALATGLVLTTEFDRIWARPVPAGGLGIAQLELLDSRRTMACVTGGCRGGLPTACGAAYLSDWPDLVSFTCLSGS